MREYIDVDVITLQLIINHKIQFLSSAHLGLQQSTEELKSHFSKFNFFLDKTIRK